MYLTLVSSRIAACLIADLASPDVKEASYEKHPFAHRRRRRSESRLQAALDLTRALDGHLTCLHVGMAPFVSGGYYMAEGTSLITRR
jgi:hypothetical protein